MVQDAIDVLNQEAAERTRAGIREPDFLYDLREAEASLLSPSLAQACVA